MSIEEDESGPKRWTLPFYCFLLNLVTGGSLRTAGLLFVAIIDDLQITRGQGSWPFSLKEVAFMLMAPVVGILSTRWSPHQVTSCGVFLFVTSFAVCYFSINIYVISVFIGVVQGCAIPMIAITVPVVLSKAFHGHRNTAMGVSNSGKSVAGFLWPPMFQFFIEQYTLKGAMLMLSGLAMHGFIGSTGLMFCRTKRTIPKSIEDKAEVDELIPLLSSSSPSYNASTSDITSHEISSKSQRHSASTGDITPQGSNENLSKLQRHSANNELSTVKNIIESDLPAADTEIASETEEAKFFKMKALKKVFSSPGFYIVSLTDFVVLNFTLLFTQIIVDYLSDKGIPVSSGLFIITAYSAGEITGQLGLGWISDRQVISRQTQLAVNITCSSTVLLVLTFSADYVVLMICGFFVGVFQGSTLTLSVAQMADYLPKAELPLALGFRSSIVGLFAFARAPVIGLFRDGLGTYDYLFWCFCSLMYAVSIVWFIQGVKNNKK